MNPQKAQADWPAAVVAGAFQTGVVLARNLERRGLRVHSFDLTSAQFGFRSVYGKTHLCPNPDTHPAEWLDFMVKLAQEVGGRPVLIPASDIYVSAIGQHASQLAPHYRFARTSSNTQALLATKQRQYDIAGQQGMPVPRTQFANHAGQVREFAAECRFPCLFKPLHEREWASAKPGHVVYLQKLVLASSAEDLMRKYGEASEISPEVVLQEIIEGPDTSKLVYLSCYSQTGERLGYSVVRQLRATPIHFGSASVCEPVNDPETAELCDQFLRRLNYVGICEIELKRDTRDGQVKMIEANPRYSVTADVAPYDGVDLGWLHYLDLLGEAVTPVKPLHRDFRHVVLRRDCATVWSYRRAGLLPLRALLASYRPPVYFFDLDWRDRQLSWETVVDCTRSLLAPLYRTFFPKKG